MVVNNSKSFFGNNGLCAGCEMINFSTGKYSITDGSHNSAVVFGNVFDGVGGEPSTWVTGTYNTSSFLTLTNVTLPADVTAAGNTLTSMFVGDGVTHGPVKNSAGLGTSCWNTGSTTAVSATSNTITFQNIGQTDGGVCGNGSTVFMWGNNGDHADSLQLAVGTPFMNVFLLNNTFNGTYPTQGQAPFIEPILMSGIDHENNIYNKNPFDPEIAYSVNGSNDNVTNANNSWTGSASFVYDLYVGGNNQTFYKDVCNSGGSILPPTKAGTNQQSVAASSNRCYPTLP
jgi:hypothetical protein